MKNVVVILTLLMCLLVGVILSGLIDILLSLKYQRSTVYHISVDSGSIMALAMLSITGLFAIYFMIKIVKQNGRL